MIAPWCLFCKGMNMREGKTNKVNVQRSEAADLPCFIFSISTVRTTSHLNRSVEKHMEAAQFSPSLESVLSGRTVSQGCSTWSPSVPFAFSTSIYLGFLGPLRGNLRNGAKGEFLDLSSGA